MAQVLPEVYDFRQHDRLWRRVQPGLEPYPEADTSGGNQAQTSDAGMTLAQESRLPGAEQNPCCMGTEAAELLTVLEGYIADELAERRLYLALAQRAPVWARQTMRELAEDEGDHARQLMTARYLITGQCRQLEALPLELVSAGDWCALLRQRYHSEVCGGMNYARTADSTPDHCLAELLNGLSAAEYRRVSTFADSLRGLQSLSPRATMSAIPLRRSDFHEKTTVIRAVRGDAACLCGSHGQRPERG